MGGVRVGGQSSGGGGARKRARKRASCLQRRSRGEGPECPDPLTTGKCIYSSHVGWLWLRPSLPSWWKLGVLKVEVAPEGLAPSTRPWIPSGLRQLEVPLRPSQTCLDGNTHLYPFRKLLGPRLHRESLSHLVCHERNFDRLCTRYNFKAHA